MFDYVYVDDKSAHCYRPIEFYNRFIDCVYSEHSKIYPLFWADHCLECGAPDCYKTCQMYEGNQFEKCKRMYYINRFQMNGMVIPIYKMKYKKWGKLRCNYNNDICLDIDDFCKQYSRYNDLREFFTGIDQLFGYIQNRSRYKYPISRFLHHNYIKKFANRKDNYKEEDEKDLIIAFYIENDISEKMILDSKDSSDLLLTRHMFECSKGQNIWKIRCKDLTRENKPINALELYPNNNCEIELNFVFSDILLSSKTKTLKPADKIKCVVWDLDNTMWYGIIGEDGIDNIILNKEAEKMIHELDQRGIIQTVCSKNDYEYAIKGLQKFGLEQYFLYPQINWENKSSNIMKISKLLNINIDTFALIDDSRFEREEVCRSLKCVRVFDERDISTLLNREEFIVPITEESKKRRCFYQSDYKRKEAYKDSVPNDYKSFIVSCEQKITIGLCINDNDINRCHELLMRTNQLNTSTNRIPINKLKEMILEPSVSVYKVSCDDKYGEYGTIGCIVIINRDKKIICTDFVISCRMAKKKVESSIIYSLMKKYSAPINIIYHESERNRVIRDELISVGGEYIVEENIIHFEVEKIKDYDWNSIIFTSEK